MPAIRIAFLVRACSPRKRIVSAHKVPDGQGGSTVETEEELLGFALTLDPGGITLIMQEDPGFLPGQRLIATLKVEED